MDKLQKKSKTDQDKQIKDEDPGLKSKIELSTPIFTTLYPQAQFIPVDTSIIKVLLSDKNSKKTPFQTDKRRHFLDNLQKTSKVHQTYCH